MDNDLKKSYWSVIPADVRYCKEIPDGSKLLYSEVTALCNEKGYCWAGNDYFAELYHVDKRTISRWIGSLSDKQFIYIDQTSGRRKLFLAHKFDPAEVAEPEHLDPAPVKKTKKVVKPKKSAKKVIQKYTEGDQYLAELLLSKIIYNFPTFENKKVNIADWAEDIRKLREIDKASVEQITFMITWVQGGELIKDGKVTHKFPPHDFWAQNIMSASKLRKQWFDNLVPKLQEYIKKTVKKNVPTQL